MGHQFEGIRKKARCKHGKKANHRPPQTIQLAPQIDELQIMDHSKESHPGVFSVLTILSNTNLTEPY